MASASTRPVASSAPRPDGRGAPWSCRWWRPPEARWARPRRRPDEPDRRGAARLDRLHRRAGDRRHPRGGRALQGGGAGGAALGCQARRPGPRPASRGGRAGRRRRGGAARPRPAGRLPPRGRRRGGGRARGPGRRRGRAQRRHRVGRPAADASGAGGRPAAGAREQGEPDSRRAAGRLARAARADRPGRLRALRPGAVPTRRSARRGRQAGDHRLWRSLPRPLRRGAGRRLARGGARPPDLADGPGGHHQLGDPDEQGPRGDRGPSAVRHPIRPDRGGRPPAEHRALHGRVPRRRDHRPALAARHAAADRPRARLAGASAAAGRPARLERGVHAGVPAGGAGGLPAARRGHRRWPAGRHRARGAERRQRGGGGGVPGGASTLPRDRRGGPPGPPGSPGPGRGRPGRRPRGGAVVPRARSYTGRRPDPHRGDRMSLIGILLFLIALMLAIFLHEGGHFLTAKLFGMKVERFFLGFGKTLWSFRRGETEYGIKVLPLGGFCKIAGMSPHEFDGNFLEEERGRKAEPVAPERQFRNKPAWQRAIVLAAGSITHFIMALVLIYALVVLIGLQIGLPTTTIQTTVATTSDGKAAPAAAAGLRSGDKIVAIDGQSISTFDQLRSVLTDKAGRRVTITYQRDGRTLTTSLVPALEKDANGQPRGFLGIGRLAGQAVSAGQWSMFVALLIEFNVFVGIFNLLPIPILDGGYLALIGWQSITRREVDLRKVAPIAAVAVSLLFVFVLVVVWLDLPNPIANPFR